MEITFSNPMYLWFLLGLPVLLLIHFYSLNKVRRNALKFANFQAIKRIVGGKQTLSKNFSLLVMRSLAVLFIVLAISGMCIWYKGFGSDTDFVLAIDTSHSMTIDDFGITRIESAKKAAKDFVDVVPQNSKIGVVSFSGSPLVVQKLHDDKILVKKSIDDVFVSVTGGTNIGDSIITSVNTLIASNHSKTIILLTDGQTNIGEPIDKAIKYANENGVIVHTIGVGSDEGGVLLGTDVVLKLDEQELVNIAMQTGGRYYRAKSKDSLKYSYEDIALIGEQKIKRDMSPIFVLFVLMLLLIEWFLINTKYRTIP